jgi:hypothetical protein
MNSFSAFGLIDNGKFKASFDHLPVMQLVTKAKIETHIIHYIYTETKKGRFKQGF